MKRRDLIIGGAGLASCVLLPTGCDWWRDRPNVNFPVPSASLIDVHCHLFNGSDLPSVRFLKIVVAEAYPKEAVRVLDIEDPDVLDGVIAILLWIVGSTRAPTAVQEMNVLDKVAPAEARNADHAANEAAVIDALTQMVADGTVAVSDDMPASSIRKARSALFAAAEETELGVSDGELSPVEAHAVAEKAYRSRFDLGILLRWFALFTRYRYVLSEQLANDYRREAFLPLLLCPALIDYDYWLGQYVDGTSLPDQVTIMGRLARRTTGPVVHSYVAFDPLRQVAHDLGKAPQFDPLQLVQHAIRDEGFLGVKLYPPMGFRAIGNNDQCQTYPDLPIIHEIASSAEDDGIYSSCSPKPVKGSLVVGKKIDSAMERLFEFCTSQNACVIAHANNSNGSNKDYGKRADPAYWIEVFKRWPTLHVNLAHFGSFNAESASAKGVPMPEGSWEWELGRYLKGHVGAPVFADISFLTEIVGQSAEQLSKYGNMINRWIKEFDPACEHLLFGSDWLMLGADPAYEGYTNRVEAFFRNCVRLDATQMRRLFSQNAARFLGLREGDAARNRLLQFYTKYGVPLSRLPSLSGA